MAEFVSVSSLTFTETVMEYAETLETSTPLNTTERKQIHITASTILLCIGLGIIIIGTIFGNVLTLTAISKHRPLQTPPYYLIASLAVADLLVAILVMPLSLTHEIVGVWMFGQILCDAWISLDVLCCTASILNLCMISVDRFCAITKPVKYPKYRTKQTMLILIAIVWLLSIIISVSPFFGWRYNKHGMDPITCQISQNKAYTIFSTFGAFFIPMSIMMVVYARIFREARRRIRGKTFNGQQPVGSATSFRERTRSQVEYSEVKKCPVVVGDPVSDISKATSDISNEEKLSGSTDSTQMMNGEGISNGTALSKNTLATSAPNLQNGHNEEKEVKKYGPLLTVPGQHQGTHTSVSLREINTNDSPSSQRSLLPSPGSLPSQFKERERKRRAIASAREHRATKTLGIVTGAFLICWLPFFLHALIVPLCEDSCYVPRTWESIFLWLGYFNSMLNPIIYTKFNQDFQKAFKKLLHCKENKSPSF